MPPDIVRPADAAQQQQQAQQAQQAQQQQQQPSSPRKAPGMVRASGSGDLTLQSAFAAVQPLKQQQQLDQQQQQPGQQQGQRPQRDARGSWRAAVRAVRAVRTSNDGADAFSGDRVDNVPSILNQRSSMLPPAVVNPQPPRLAVMVHCVRGLPTAGSGAGPADAAVGSVADGAAGAAAAAGAGGRAFYVKAGVHMPRQLPDAEHKRSTAPMRQLGSGVAWDALFTLSPPRPEAMELTLSLKYRPRFTTAKVVWGTVTLPLLEVVQHPSKWGCRQALPLQGGRLAGSGAVLEVQLFLSSERVASPISVLAATWNVGNALPPPPEQLSGWLRGAQETSEHHLVAVGAQECNYTRDARRSVTAGGSTHVRTPVDRSMRDGRAAEVQAATAAGAQQPASSSGGASPEPPANGAALEPQRSPPLPASPQPPWTSAGSAADLSLRHGSTRAALKNYLLDQVDSAAAWERHISVALGSQYWLVAAEHMFQTRLLIFARSDVVPAISSISKGFEATGIARIGLNKGGVAVGLKLDDTHLTFVASHLAAHQGKTAQRNLDVAEIATNLSLPDSAAAKGADLVTSAHHVVWVGDLNYRLDYGQQADTHSDSPTAEDFASQCQLIEQQQFEQLVQLDQLRKEVAAGRVFAGFAEAPLTFAPTFKVARGVGCTYLSKRSPAWCDRVLFKSALPHKAASCSAYFADSAVATSDHKPVAAVLSVPLSTDTVTSSRAAGGGGGGGLGGGLRSGGSSIAAAFSSGGGGGGGAGSGAPRSATPFKLYISAARLGGHTTWANLAKRVDPSERGGSADAADAGAAAGGGQAGGDARRRRRRLKLQLVVSGACLGSRREHVLRVDAEAARACRDAAQQPSLLTREESMPLLLGPVQQLTDDWLLLSLVLCEGSWQRKTLARAVLPLQPAVAEYQARSFKAITLPLLLEAGAGVVGQLDVTVQLISSLSVRASMYDAIRRMRALTAARSTSLAAARATLDHDERGIAAGGSEVGRGEAASGGAALSHSSSTTAALARYSSWVRGWLGGGLYATRRRESVVLAEPVVPPA